MRVCFKLVAAMLLIAVGSQSAFCAERLDAFRARSLMLRQAWTLLRHPDGTSEKTLPAPESVRAGQGELEKSAAVDNAVGKSVHDYLQVRANFLTHIDKPVAIAPLSYANAPELIVLLLESDPDKALEVNRKRKATLGTLLPVTAFGRIAIDFNSSHIGESYHGPIPKTNPQLLQETALFLKTAGKYDLAWRAYAEVAYSATTPLVQFFVRQNWLSERTSELWFETAQCAFLARRQELAWEYLMKAAVYGSNDLHEKCLQTAAEWDENPKPLLDNIPENQVRDALAKAIQAYAQLNAHPRAWQLIEMYPESFKDPEQLTKDLQQAWLEVWGDPSLSYSKLVVYGQEVYPEGSLLDVRIPWALTDEALKSAQQQINETLKE